MKKITQFLAAGLLVASFSSCITMTSVTVSDVKPGGGSEVSAYADGMGFLYLTAPRDLGEKVAAELAGKGAVSNISTSMTMRNWGIVQYYKVTAKGSTGK
jgi:hypothetical protein